jgi:hypothetical protein
MSGYRHACRRIAATLGATFAATAVAVVALPGTAGASHPRPVCNLIVDPIGDAEDAVDVVSGDVASGATTVVGALRLRTLTPNDPTTLTGTRWDLAFTAGAARYTFSLRRDALGAITSTFTRRPVFGAVTTIAAPYTLLGSTVRWTVARTDVPDLPAAPAYDPLSDLVATTYATPLDLTADVAFATQPYLDGWPSCLKAS